MSEDQIQAIKDRLAAAVQGPMWWTTEEDYTFIAHAPGDIAYLLGELERLHEWVRRAYPVVVIAAAGNPPGDHWQPEAQWARDAMPLRSEWCRSCHKEHALLPWERVCA